MTVSVEQTVLPLVFWWRLVKESLVTETKMHETFLKSWQDSAETEVRPGAPGGLVLFPLMILPVKICRAASATVIRGPASQKRDGAPASTSFRSAQEKRKWFRLKTFQNIIKSIDIFALRASSFFSVHYTYSVDGNRPKGDQRERS